jgi:UDPglucose--hexose-1-phosphate uridylyltransferase
VSELRHDPIQRQWVIVATQRAARPSGYQVRVSEEPPEFCPFCPCNEDKTPPEIFAMREGFSAPNSPGWQVRVVPNKFPAVGLEGDLQRTAVGVYDRMRGVGAHEIIIEAPLHTQHMAEQPVEHLAKVLRTYRERMKSLLDDSRFLYVMVFRNHGEMAGATLPHPHSQVIALPILPNVLETELQSARDHYRRTERCLFCDIIQQERDATVRMVADHEGFAVFAPYASRSPYELCLMPLDHEADFTQISDSQCASLSKVLSETLRRLKSCLNNPPYNFILHSSPNPRSRAVAVQELPDIHDAYHWHIEIIPRLSKPAGFEWGTGFHINSTPPEEAAESLRAVNLT